MTNRNRKKESQTPIVVQLDDYRPTAQRIDPARAAAIAKWHLEQGASAPGSSALLSISIGADGAPKVTAIGIEPEHALAMLSTIDGVADRLANIAGAPILYVNRKLASNGVMQAIARLSR